MKTNNFNSGEIVILMELLRFQLIIKQIKEQKGITK